MDLAIVVNRLDIQHLTFYTLTVNYIIIVEIELIDSQKANCYHIQGKITECRLAETEGIIFNHEGTCGNQEGMIN